VIQQPFLQQNVFGNASTGEAREVCEMFVDHAPCIVSMKILGGGV